MHALLDFLDGNDDAIPPSGLDIGVLPPNNATADLTDEDSGGEEDPKIDNVPASQINAPVLPPTHISFQMREQAGEQPRKEQPVQEPVQGKRRRRAATVGRKRQKVQQNFSWKKEVLCDGFAPWPQITTVSNELKTPLDYFFLFFDEEVWELLVKYTNQYAAKRNRLGDCSEHEMKCFVAILLLSGYCTVSRKHMYWEQNQDCHNVLVSNAMSRARFQFIMTNLHVCNNDELDQNDKFAKIRPLLKMLSLKFVEFTPHKAQHSVDESMVPYFGRHGTKQFIRGKPIRYGFKFWCGGPSTGYLTWLEPYQGAGTVPAHYEGQGLGFGVVMSYVDQLPKFPYTIYCDNLFTSSELLEALSARGVRVTGTIRANRIPKSCSILSPEVMKTKPRGFYDYCSDNDKKISIVKWNDNNIVSMATNSDSVNPTKTVKRFSQAQKRKISVDQPALINNYNSHMGGIEHVTVSSSN